MVLVIVPILYLLMAVGAARMRRLENYGLAITGVVFAVITLPLLPLTLPLACGRCSSWRGRRSGRSLARLARSAAGVGRLRIRKSQSSR